MKSYRVTLSDDAEAQLLALYRYLAVEAGSAIAKRYVDAIVEQCEKLCHFPDRGTPRSDLRPGLRTIAFRRRVTIGYAVGADEVRVVGIYYGGQDYEAALSEGASDR